MKAENTQIQMRKGVLEYCVLLVIDTGDVYASDLIDQLTRAGLLVVEGTLYPLLTRLKKAGLLDYRWEESPNGPPRKYYTLTDDGRNFKSKLAQTWDELNQATQTLINAGK